MTVSYHPEFPQDIKKYEASTGKLLLAWVSDFGPKWEKQSNE